MSHVNNTRPRRAERGAAHGGARPDPGWLKELFENQRYFSPEEELKYYGQYVAWSWDGTRIVASAKTDVELFDKLEAMGQDSSRGVIGFIGEG